jgi:hypothetical protein
MRWILVLSPSHAFSKTDNDLTGATSEKPNFARASQAPSHSWNVSGVGTIRVPVIFMFVPGMPVVVNRKTYQGLKLVNGSDYKALDVIVPSA